MATLASRILTASWKLTHGFTLSMETAIGEINIILTNLTLTFLKVYLQLENIYSEYVNYVTNQKAFERDVEFQIGYEQPPIESQISEFVTMAEVNEDKVLDISGAVQRMVQRLPDPPEEGQDTEHGSSEQEMEVESDQPHTLKDVHKYVVTFEKDLLVVLRHLSYFQVPRS
jgi:hypothetical protein